MLNNPTGLPFIGSLEEIMLKKLLVAAFLLPSAAVAEDVTMERWCQTDANQSLQGR